MRPFLCLDNWHTPQAETRFEAYLGVSGLTVHTMHTNEGAFPEHANYCGAYVSPSFDGANDDKSWIHREHSVLRMLADAGVPMVGLCFGSQILASALVGRDQVFVRNRREIGFGEIQLTQAGAKDVLASSLPAEFPVFHWHGDEVGAGHPDVVVLAESSGCANQLWRWSRGPIWGVQPHLELDRQGLVAWFEDNTETFEAAGMDRNRMVSEAHDSEAGFCFLKNFVSFVLEREGCGTNARNGVNTNLQTNWDLSLARLEV